MKSKGEKLVKASDVSKKTKALLDRFAKQYSFTRRNTKPDTTTHTAFGEIERRITELLAGKTYDEGAAILPDIAPAL
ncbi:MAG: hypothetical protein ABII89_03135 [Candidatus Omnitrophota bacterium]